MPRFVLVHSPLVGPMTWSLVADVLREGGEEAIVPSLRLAPAERREAPYWAEHARAVARAVEVAGGRGPLTLVGHSGAGPLLPAVRQALDDPVEGYLFVDAGLPRDGASRLEMFGDPEMVEAFRGGAVAGSITPWTDEDLRPVIPDDAVRAAFVADLHPMPLAVYEEPLPVFEGWPDAPCGYLLLSDVYRDDAARARALGWPVAEMEGGHFHMLVDPAAVGFALLALRARLGEGAR